MFKRRLHKTCLALGSANASPGAPDVDVQKYPDGVLLYH